MWTAGIKRDLGFGDSLVLFLFFWSIGLHLIFIFNSLPHCLFHDFHHHGLWSQAQQIHTVCYCSGPMAAVHCLASGCADREEDHWLVLCSECYIDFFFVKVFCCLIVCLFVWTHPKWTHSGEILNSYWVDAISHRNTTQCLSMALSKPETCLTNFFLENMNPWHLKPQSSGLSTRPHTPNSPWMLTAHFWLAYSKLSCGVMLLYGNQVFRSKLTEATGP